MTIVPHHATVVQKSQPMAGTASPVVQQRPVPTVAQVKNFAMAIFSGKFAVAEIVAQRMATCRQCDKLRVSPAGVEWCGVCGCRVSRKDREITNLAAYEENLPKWGCKHPLRGQGKGWGAISFQLSAVSGDSENGTP